MHLKNRNRKMISFQIMFILTASFLLVPLLNVIPVGGAPGSWWNSNWAYRKAVTIDHTKVVGTLNGFPVLIDLTDANLASKAQSDGDDIAFVDAGTGTKLDHEIEYFGSDSGHLSAWVKVPSLSQTTDTVIYMYYGNLAAGSQQNPSAVWDSNAKMVLHLNQTSGIQYDSSANANNALPYGGVSQGVPGKIVSADNFDGINDYLEVSHSNTIAGFTSALTVSFWVRLDDLSRRQAFLNKYDSNGNKRGWFIEYNLVGEQHSFPAFFASQDGISYKDWYSSFTPSASIWYYVTVVWQANALPTFYINGQQSPTVQTGTISSIYNNVGTPLHVGKSTYASGRELKGGLDEISLSNVARPVEWIRTGYNNQASPATFYSVGPEEVPTNSEPTISNGSPVNGATGVLTNPTLSIYVTDPEGDMMTVIFETNSTGTWKNIGVYANVGDGTYTCIPTTLNQLGTQYYWKCSVTDDGSNWTNGTYSFTTTSTVLTQKWMKSGAVSTSNGVLIADVNDDGREEVIHAGQGGVMVLNGTDGSVIWSRNVVGANISCQAEIADLNNDGKFEIVVPIVDPAGIEVLFGSNGSTYWRRTDLGGWLTADTVIADIDGSGYKTIFAGSMWTVSENNDGKITSLSYDGRILNQVWSWHPCAGGFSIADTDNDGQFELYIGDRNSGFGRGLRSLWASNLTVRWEHPEIMCSSNRPMLADVNKDGKLDVIIGHHSGGIGVFNSKDGSVIREDLGLGRALAPVHYQPSVFDIDGDGNLEMLMGDNEHTTTLPTVWDLVKWQVDAQLPVTAGKFGPQVADVTGDGLMDIIITNEDGVYVFSYNRTSGSYYSAGQVSGLNGRFMNAVVQDIDGDGYNEVVVPNDWEPTSIIYAFDTPARRPDPRPRTEVRFYSERRNGVQQYISLPGAKAPIVLSPLPADGTTNAPLSLSQLTFTLSDFQKTPMNYVVTTVPNIGSGHGEGVANGIYAVGISGLVYNTVYTWRVNVTDGVEWTNKTFTFKTQKTPPWWNTAWQYRKTIAIDQSKVNGDQTNFPVLIDLVDGSLTGKAQPDGDDFVFTDGTQTKLSHEIEQYDAGLGHLTAWVKVPFLSSSASTFLYLYYGNSVSGNQQDTATVWDSSNRMVLHFDEKTGTHHDSTVNGNNGTPNNGVVQGASGKIDGSDTFDGVNGYVEVAHSTSISGFTEALTVSFWLRLDDVSRRQVILNKYNTVANQRGWYVEYQTNSLGFFASQDGSAFKEWRATFTPTVGTWYYIAVVWQANTVPKFYVNGVQVTMTGDATTLASIFNNVGVPLLLGKCPYDATRHLRGGLDEIRISNPARSAGWMLTSYTNQKDPAQFYSVGQEEIASA